MLDKDDIINNYCSKLGISRHKFTNKNVNGKEKIQITYAFGDVDSSLIFLNIIYSNYIYDENLYNIVISWPGMQSICTKVDEYWHFTDENTINQLVGHTDGIDNTSIAIASFSRSLRENFFNVYSAYDYKSIYLHHLNENAFLKKEIKINLPDLIPATSLNNSIIKRIDSVKKNIKSLVFMPFKYSYSWNNGKKVPEKKSEDVMEEILIALSEEFDVLCIQNNFTLDLSKNIKKDNIIFLQESNFQKIISYIQFMGCYFDYFSNTNILGIFGRSFVYSVIDKPSWFAFKKYQDLSFYEEFKNCRLFSSFNYFYGFDEDIRQKFVESIVKKIKLCDPTWPVYNKSETVFNLENLCKAKLNYIQKKKIFFGVKNEKS